MQDIQTRYKQWLQKADESLQFELSSISNDNKAIMDAFYCDLSFGTGGLRGLIGAGPNRMNVHTVAKATQGLANYLTEHSEKPSVVIARDSRNMGEDFCKIAASVFAANNIRVFIFPRIEPTPALSFAVRELGCSAGICITASHNPSVYNGYKVYGEDGCQITIEAAEKIQTAIDSVDIFEDIDIIEFELAVDNGTIQWIKDDILNRYIDSCASVSLGSIDEGLRIVYTPLHGAGLECVSKVLERIGVSNLIVEPKQAIPNGDFPTCPYPNPEIPEALEHGLALAKKVKSDLLLATDPDADRVGVAVIKNGEPVLLTGNEIGILLADYICNMKEAQGKNLENQVVISTIVSSAMIDALANDRGFELRRTLTGFKYIGEQISLLEAEGQVGRFMLGFEESYGYLAGAHVRDKDAVVSSMLICEMVCFYKSKGMDLIDVLGQLSKKYGYFKNSLISVDYPGVEGFSKMSAITTALRSEYPTKIADLRVESVIDYKTGIPMPIINSKKKERQILPHADVLEFRLEGGNKLIIRPSGTEPKIKAYLFAKSTTLDGAINIRGALELAAETLLR